MNKIWNKTSRKGIATGLLIVLMMLTTVLPVWAAENQTPDISPWAVGDLNEGEKYGIYPMEWYYQDFRTEVSQERLEVLLESTSSKIEAIGLEKKDEFVPVSYKGDGTRGDVIIRLYNILGEYGLVSVQSPVEYMQERGIIQGTSKGLELDSICTTEQSVILATRLITDTYNVLGAGSKGLAWKVEHNGNTVYLLGSIHVGSNELYPLNQKLKKAFDESDTLVVEANLLNPGDGLEYFMTKSMYQDGTNLEDVLSQETYEKLLKVLNQYGIQSEAISTYKPWRLANDLSVMLATNSEDTQQSAQAAGLGIDVYFLLNAFLSQKPIAELEGIKYQADLFDGLSVEFQEEYLEAILDSILEPQEEEGNTSADLLDEWVNLWIKGDIEGFTSSYTQSIDGTENELTNMLFGKRDLDMSENIRKMLDSEEKGTYFVVVGAGHLVTENSIVHLLKEMGYVVEVVQ